MLKLCGRLELCTWNNAVCDKIPPTMIIYTRIIIDTGAMYLNHIWIKNARRLNWKNEFELKTGKAKYFNLIWPSCFWSRNAYFIFGPNPELPTSPLPLPRNYSLYEEVGKQLFTMWFQHSQGTDKRRMSAINRTQIKKHVGSAIVHCIRCKGLEYAPKQYRS